MPSHWNDLAASRCEDALELRAYSSRLLGADPDLVLMGGGNTSLKTIWSRSDGTSIDCLYVKGTGADLGEVTPADFTPLALEPVRRLLDLQTLDSGAMIAALEPLKLRADSPKPSIETLLHAAMPASHVEHTHADSILALINTSCGRSIAAALFGELAPVVPFRHSGFDLAKACVETLRQHRTRRTIGLILEFHGVVAFADDARTAYENMLALVDLAERHLQARNAWKLRRSPVPKRSPESALALARLRSQLSAAAGFPMVLHVAADVETMGFATRPDLADIAMQGPPTPQHAVFTKRLPLLGRDVQRYAVDYRAYLAQHTPSGISAHRVPDPAPRIVLDPEFGLIAASVDARHARITADVYRHDSRIISRAAAHDRYVSLPPEAVLLAELHYGGFDRRLRTRASQDLPLLGQVALVLPDAAARIDELMDQGAAVICVGGATSPREGLYVLPALDPEALADAVHAFGGIDSVVTGDGASGGMPFLDEVLALTPNRLA